MACVKWHLLSKHIGKCLEISFRLIRLCLKYIFDHLKCWFSTPTTFRIVHRSDEDPPSRKGNKAVHQPPFVRLFNDTNIMCLMSHRLIILADAITRSNLKAAAFTSWSAKWALKSRHRKICPATNIASVTLWRHQPLPIQNLPLTAWFLWPVYRRIRGFYTRLVNYDGWYEAHGKSPCSRYVQSLKRDHSYCSQTHVEWPQSKNWRSPNVDVKRCVRFQVSNPPLFFCLGF